MRRHTCARARVAKPPVFGSAPEDSGVAGSSGTETTRHVGIEGRGEYVGRSRDCGTVMGMLADSASLIRELGFNAGLIALLAAVYGLALSPSSHPDATVRRSRNTLLFAFGGVLFGAVGIVAMMAPVEMVPGVYLDSKSIIITLASAYLPFGPAALAATMVGVVRVGMGGAGVLAGVVSVVLSVAMGMAWRRWRPRLDHQLGGSLSQPVWLLSLGLCGSLVALFSLALLPAEARTVVLPVMVLPAFVIFPGAIVVFGFLFDSLFRLRKREAVLRQTLQDAQQAASLFHHGRDGIVILAPDRTILDANPAFCEMNGYTRDELLGQPSELIRVDSEEAEVLFNRIIDKVRQDGRWQGEIMRRRKNGEVYVADVTFDASFAPDGTVQQWVSISRDTTEQKRHAEEVARAASFDPLSGLPNRRLLMQELQACVNGPRRGERPVGVCVLDVDDFKAVNDRLGFAKGDAVLRELAARIKTCLREGDMVGRVGGDEFVLILTQCENPGGVIDQLEEVRRCLRLPLAVDGGELKLSSSVGVTLYPADHADGDTLLRHADLAMFQAKEKGKDRIYVFDAERDVKAQERRESVRRIEQALEAGEMVLYFQPKVRLADGAVVGAETLIRWHHPERGVLVPGVFLGVIQGTPVAQNLDYWVLRRAMACGHAWMQAGVHLPLSVNLSVATLVEPRFLVEVRKLLKTYSGLPRNFLEIELLESDTMDDLTMVDFVIQDLAQMGVLCSIDDFGTGYSSLTYLQRLSAQSIKIDQSFVRDMLDNPKDRALVQGVIGLARAFDRQVVAEGVETAAHAATLNEMGCDVLQGYGVARPMPADQLLVWQAAWQMPDAFVPPSVREAVNALVKRVG